jgi:iron complex outermembrane receptor protein
MDESGQNIKDKPKDNIITVTSQHREENLQEVPISIAVFDNESLRKLVAEDIDDLGNYTPGLETNNLSVTQPKYRVRGISTNDFGIGSDPAVAVYIDGVYIGRSGSAQLNFNDIERVEILKGPQGTLFGRNAAAGAIHVITKKPSQDSEGNLSLTFGSFNKQKIEALYNSAISHNLFFRGSININQMDGFIENGNSQVPAPYNNGLRTSDFGEESDRSARMSLLYIPEEGSEITWRMDWSKLDNDPPMVTSLNQDAMFIRNNLGLPDLTRQVDSFGAYQADDPGWETRDVLGTSIEFTRDLGAATFTSITAYRKFDSVNYEEEDGSANPRYRFNTANVEDQSQFSQEFRLSGRSESDHRWTMGANFFSENAKQTHDVYLNINTLDSFVLWENRNALLAANQWPDINGNGIADAGELGYIPSGTGIGLFLADGFANELAQISALTGVPVDQLIQEMVALNLNRTDPSWHEATHNTGKFRSFAFFVDVTWAITDKLDLTTGIRYTHDQKSLTIDSRYQNQIILPQGLGSVPFGFAFYDQFDKVKQRDNWTDWTPRLVIDYQWTDQMMTYFSASRGFKSGGFNSLGLDPAFDPEQIMNYEAGMKSSWLDDSLRFNLSIFDYDYEGLQILKLTGPAGQIPTYNVGNADAAGNGTELEFYWQINQDFRISANWAYLDTQYTKYDPSDFPGETETLVGKPLASTPKHTWNLDFEYNLNLGTGDLVFAMNYSHIGDRISEPTTPRDERILGYELVNARIGYFDASGDWDMALWATNLTDEEYLIFRGGIASAVGSVTTARGKPRMIGVDFRYYF